MINESPSDPASAAETSGGETAADGRTAVTEDQVRLALRKVKDPELNLNIMDLGLVYDVQVEDDAVQVDMTLTSPGCPAGPMIMTDAERAIRGIPGVRDLEINLVWSPMWTPERIEPRVRAYMGL